MARPLDDVFMCAAWYADCAVDWQAVGAIGAFAAALAAVLLGLSQLLRDELQRHRRAVALSLALAEELELAAVLSGVVSALANAQPATPQRFNVAAAFAVKVSAPVLKASLHQLDCFSPREIRYLTVALADLEKARFLLAPFGQVIVWNDGMTEAPAELTELSAEVHQSLVGAMRAMKARAKMKEPDHGKAIAEIVAHNDPELRQRAVR